MPWLAFSGAWDGTIRVWDTRACTAMHVLADHHADVYSIVSHPMRPSVLLSTSRDTTIRTWSLTELMTAVSLPLALGLTTAEARAVPGLTNALCGNAASEMQSPSILPQACCGVGGRALAQRLSSISATGEP